MLTCFGCWPLVAKITCIQARFLYVHALFNIHVQCVHSKCLIKCPNDILLLFWTPISTKILGITIIIHVQHVLIIGGVFYTLFPVSAYSCISHASHMHTKCTFAAHTLTFDMFCTSLMLVKSFYTFQHLTYSCVYLMPRFTSCSIIFSMSCLLYALQHFFRCFCLLFELHFLIHLASLMHHLLPLFISYFLSLLSLDSFVYKKGESILESIPVCFVISI